jgi:hypothetical protein
MKLLFATLLCLCLLLAGTMPSLAAAVGSGGDSPAPMVEQAPIPPADVGPLPAGSESAGPGVTEIVIGAVVVGGAFAVGLAAEGGLSAAIASAVAVVLIYSILP